MRFGRILALLCCLALTPACLEAAPTVPAAQTTAALPTIAELRARLSDGLVTFTIAATDPAGGPVDIAWSASGGKLSATSGSSTIFQPLAPGSFTVTATVTTRAGQVRTATQALTVLAGNRVEVTGTPVFDPPSDTAVVTTPGTNTSTPVAGAPTTVTAPFQQGVARPGASRPAPTPFVWGFATPTPRPAATPTPIPQPSPSATPTPQPGVPVPPPSTWVLLDPTRLPSNMLLNDVHFPPGADGLFNTGFAVGANGTVLRSTDSGRTWAARGAGVPARDLTCVFFTSETEGLIAGHNGLVMRTTDGGASWQDISPGVVSDVVSLVVINAQSALVGFLDGPVQRSDNLNAATPAGVSWVGIDSAPSVSLGAGANLPGADATLAWFVGDGIYRYDSDGADDFERVRLLGPSVGKGSAVAMASATTFWAGTDAGKIFKSTDGGADWSEVGALSNREYNGGSPSFAITSSIKDMHFSGPNHGVILTSNATIYDTNNGGASWKETRLPATLSAVQVQRRVVSSPSGPKEEFFGWGVGLDGAIVRYVPN